MGYFNINAFLYNIRKILKYSLFLLLFLGAIFLVIFFSSNVVFADTGDIPCNPTGQNIRDLPVSYYNAALNYFESSNYTDYFIIRTDNHNSGPDFWLILFNALDTDTFFTNTTGISNTGFYWFMSNRSGTLTYTYSITESNNTININYISNSLSFGSGANKYQIRGVYSGTQPVYYNSGSNTADLSKPLYIPVTTTPPALYPPADSNQLSNLTSGNFTFFIVNPGSISVNDTIILDIWDLSTDYNGSNPVASYELNKDSAFFQYTNISETEYQYVLTARFLDWFQLINGKTYRAVLSYFDSNGVTNAITYDWTMNIDSSQQQVIADTIQQDINKGIQDMNSFLTDDKYDDDSILNNMPNSDAYIDPAGDGLLGIFTALETAFTTNEATPVRFYIPFTDGQYIDIPANLTKQHIPQVILFLVQSVYWYIICRYIVKDISNTANKMKSGEILDSKDGNIRTELL